MDKNVVIHLAVFVGVLLALNYFFHLHISIIGSLVLTLGLNFVMGLFQSKSTCRKVAICLSLTVRLKI